MTARYDNVCNHLFDDRCTNKDMLFLSAETGLCYVWVCMDGRERKSLYTYTKTLQCCKKTVSIHSDAFIFHPSLCSCCSLSWQWTCYWAQKQPTSFYLCREICVTTYWFLSLSPRNSVFHPVKPLSCSWAELEMQPMHLVFTVSTSNVNEQCNELPIGSPLVFKERMFCVITDQFISP